jgi:peptidoglycan/xylan/chitin deacetylase (PgdA/CDA1 family)
MMDLLQRSLGSLLARGNHGRRLLILTYHRVLDRPDPMLEGGGLDVAGFDEQLRVLAANFNVLRLDEALHRLASASLPPRAVALTFDDGYGDNYTNALPILQRHGLSATFFVATAFLNGGRMWNDTLIESLRRASGPRLDLSVIGLAELDIASTAERRASCSRVIDHLKHRAFLERQHAVEYVASTVAQPLPADLMMTDAQVRGLRDAGMHVGAHTASHPVLAAVDDATAQREIADGRDYLRELLREPVDIFAYPNGRPGRDYSRQHVELVKQLGFKSAMSTAWGYTDAQSDLWQAPRIAPWDPVPWRFGLRLLRAYREPQAAAA